MTQAKVFSLGTVVSLSLRNSFIHIPMLLGRYNCPNWFFRVVVWLARPSNNYVAECINIRTSNGPTFHRSHCHGNGHLFDACNSYRHPSHTSAAWSIITEAWSTQYTVFANVIYVQPTVFTPVVYITETVATQYAIKKSSSIDSLPNQRDLW